MLNNRQSSKDLSDLKQDKHRRGGGSQSIDLMDDDEQVDDEDSKFDELNPMHASGGGSSSSSNLLVGKSSLRKTKGGVNPPILKKGNSTSSLNIYPSHSSIELKRSNFTNELSSIFLCLSTCLPSCLLNSFSVIVTAVLVIIQNNMNVYCFSSDISPR